MNHLEIADYSPVHEAEKQAQLDSDKKKPSRRKLAPCFHCGKQLWGCNITKMVNSQDALVRGFHKSCANELVRDDPNLWRKL